MPLTIGTRLGPYEILCAIGAGGMGEVYRARDTRLNRDVALKVLPEAFARDSQRMGRFDREAKVLASLNHPNIAAIYGIEESGPIKALVMELVEGPTLADRIRSGAIPLDEALPIGRQVADAVEYAHDKNVIHRDLKPANIKVKEDGTVKVLDFGLAKALSDDPTEDDMSNSPTLSMAATRQGVILGTAAYMSPEQAKGKVVDRRADVWAFGAVLYEVLTGKQAFTGEDVTEILVAVMSKEPALDTLPANTPPAIRNLLHRCLDRNIKRRLAHIAEARILIEDVLSGALAAPKNTLVTPAAAAPASKLPWPAVAAALGVIAIVASGIAWRATRPIEQPLKPLARLDVDLGPDVSLGSVTGTDAILSPDGTRMAYVSQGRLFTRRLDQPNVTELAGTQGAFAPFFSPDGQWVAFFGGLKLRKISVEGGSAITLCAVGNAGGGSWSEDDSIIAALPGGLSRIPSAGGAPTPLTDSPSGELIRRWPQVLPGGKAVLYTAATSGTFDTANIEVMSLADHRTNTLVRGGTFGRYLPSGYLIYVNRGTLFAVPFDLDRLELHGTPAPVLDQIAYSATDGSAQLDFSESGTLIYRTGGAGVGLSTVGWLDAAGKVQPLLAKPGAYGRPSLSPDGHRLAIEVSEGLNTSIWVYDEQRDAMTRLTFTGNDQGPVWSPDGRYIAFQTVGEGSFATRSDGAGRPQPLVPSKNPQFPWSFSPDGKRLAFFEQSSGTRYDLWTLPLESDSAGLRAGKPEVFLQTAAVERFPVFSPDGRWIAYSSNESGTFQVYVRAFPDKGGKWQISDGDGVYPMWSRNGRELFFETLDNHIMVAAYTVKSDSFVADKPRMWSETQLGGLVNSVKNVDLAPDGQRMVALIPAQAAEGQKPLNHVIFVENFFDEVRRRVRP